MTLFSRSVTNCLYKRFERISRYQPNGAPGFSQYLGTGINKQPKRWYGYVVQIITNWQQVHYRSSKISLSGLTFPIITSSIDFDDFGILMTATFKSLREITLLWSLLIKCIRGLKMIIRLRVFKDLPKEFDTVDHSTLITNLTVVKSKM